jgi:hypothetical protein
MTVLVVPSSIGAVPTAVQSLVPTFVFCCKVKPVEGESQDTATVFVVVQAMVSDGRRVLVEYLMVA